MTDHSDPGETKLKLAEPLVDEVIAAMDSQFSDEERDLAAEYANRSDWEHPINRSPTAVAAAAVYLASLIESEPVSQTETMAAAGVSEHALRGTFYELAEHEGIDLEQTKTERLDRMRALQRAREEHGTEPG